MRRKTTYIVGAGASFEFGFPIGAGLTNEISEVLRISLDSNGNPDTGDKDVLYGLPRVSRNLPPPPIGVNRKADYLYSIANSVSKNMPLALSIDNFLDAKKKKVGFSEIGKFAIALQILRHERECGLWIDPNQSEDVDFSLLSDNWLLALFRILSAQKGIDEFLSALRSCRFVTFNYDRVIEKFFRDAIKSYFDLSKMEANQAIYENLKIVHVYGDLGNLLDKNSVGFGGGHDFRRAADASLNIRTFTEGPISRGRGVFENDSGATAARWCEDTDTLVFLGFSFLPLNLNAIRPRRSPGANKRVYGTVYGMSEDNVLLAELMLRRTWFDGSPNKMSLRPLTCLELVSEISGYLGGYDLVQ